MIVKDCVITEQDSEVIREYKVDDTLATKSNPKVRLSAEAAYCGCSGRVVLVNGDTVVVYDDENKYGLKYSKLRNIDTEEVYASCEAYPGMRLGDCKSYLDFEFLTNTPNPFPVRVGNLTLYKSDPMPFISSGYESVEISNMLTSYHDAHPETGDGILYDTLNDDLERDRDYDGDIDDTDIDEYFDVKGYYDVADTYPSYISEEGDGYEDEYPDELYINIVYD